MLVAGVLDDVDGTALLPRSPRILPWIAGFVTIGLAPSRLVPFIEFSLSTVLVDFLLLKPLLLLLLLLLLTPPVLVLLLLEDGVEDRDGCCTWI